MKTFTIKVTQFLRPNGRRRIVDGELPISVRRVYNDMVTHGCQITLEELSNGQVSAAITNGKRDIDMSVTPNDESVTDGIVRMLKRQKWIEDEKREERQFKTRKPPYTLQNAVKVARYFEKRFKPNYHIALGGSCLHQGLSEKDIDLYIYPSSEETLRGTDAQYILRRIRELGGKIKKVMLRVKFEVDYPNKPMIQFVFKGYPVDLFLVQWDSIDRHNPQNNSSSEEQYGSTYDDDDIPF